MHGNKGGSQETDLSFTKAILCKFLFPYPLQGLKQYLSLSTAEGFSSTPENSPGVANGQNSLSHLNYTIWEEKNKTQKRFWFLLEQGAQSKMEGRKRNL